MIYFQIFTTFGYKSLKNSEGNGERTSKIGKYIGISLITLQTYSIITLIHLPQKSGAARGSVGFTGTLTGNSREGTPCSPQYILQPERRVGAVLAFDEYGSGFEAFGVVPLA